MRPSVSRALCNVRCSAPRPSAIRPAKTHLHLPLNYNRCLLSSTTRLRSARDADPSGGEERQWSTPLAKQLGAAISSTGPVPLASYMRMCLTGDLGGYYTGALGQGRDQFGQTGDFVTSPEISQVFGELVGVWFVTEWFAQGRRSKGVELIEVGPGRGTLMDDMLRTIQNFKAMTDSIDTIYMVEASPELRQAQKNLLCGEDAPMTKTEVGYQSVTKSGSIPIVWAETIQSVPMNPLKMPFIVAHEFFDALPIHAFQCVDIPPPPAPSTPDSSSSPSPSSSSPLPPPRRPRPRPKDHTTATGPQWREFLVSPTPPGSTHASLNTPGSQSRDTPPPDFQLTLAKTPTRHSLYLPESSPRYRALRSRPGSLVEICPDAALYAADFARRIGNAHHTTATDETKGRGKGAGAGAGAALILDYGPEADVVPANSLRGIRAHRLVSPFAEPGRVDLSADVDFSALAEASLAASGGVEVHGPVEQGAFLEMMGVRERGEALVRRLRGRKGTTTAITEGGEEEKRAADVEKAWKRLVDRGPNGMGRVYKALAILPENGGRRRPVGFGGDVVP